MKPINGWDKVQAMRERVKLPAGGYEAKIIGAKVVETKGSNGTFERLEIAVDITAGEYENYYKNDYDSNTRDDKKWKGVCRLFVPVDDGSDKDNLTKSILKGATTAIEDSNHGYHWDWDEGKLKGKKVGILVRDKEWEFNGKTGFAPEAFKLISIEDVREGKFKIPEPKLLDSNTATASSTAPESTAATTETDDDYPF